MPAAAEPVAASGQRLRWNAETSTLVKVDEQLATGDRFEIVSAMPVYTAEELQAATSRQPPDPIYLELPDDFPSSVAEQASVLTAGAPSAYDAAIALQNWFRSEFEYSIDVPQGHGNSAIEAFLRQRIGYCEQFAGTFAAMMRSLGIPARVAVGFTPGLGAARRHRSRCSGATPTPGRRCGSTSTAGSPSSRRRAAAHQAPSRTPGSPPAQDETVPVPGERLTAVQMPALVPADAPAARRFHRPTSCRTRPAPAAPPSFSPISVRVEGPQLGVRRDPHRRRRCSALAALTPELVRRWRRRHPDPDVSKQVRDLWERALGAVEATGFRIDPSLTPIEQARAAAPRLPVAARPLKSLAALATEATFAPDQQVQRDLAADGPGRARPPPMGPPGRADRRRLDDRQRPPAPLLHDLEVGDSDDSW